MRRKKELKGGDRGKRKEEKENKIFRGGAVNPVVAEEEWWGDGGRCHGVQWGDVNMTSSYP